MAYPYTTGESPKYPGRKYVKPPRKKEERDEGRPPFEEPGIGDIFKLPLTITIEDVKDNIEMKPGRTAFATKKFERDAQGKIRFDQDGKPMLLLKRDVSGNVVLNAKGEEEKEEQEDIVVGDERGLKFHPLKPLSWVSDAKKFAANTASWNTLSGQVEAKIVWDDYLMKQELGNLFYEKDASGKLVLKKEAEKVREHTLTFVQRGRIPAPTRFRGPYDKILYHRFYLEKMEKVLRDSGFDDDANLIRKALDETEGFDKSNAGKALKELEDADKLRLAADRAGTPGDRWRLVKRAEVKEKDAVRLASAAGFSVGKGTPVDLCRLREDLEAEKNLIIKSKAAARPEHRNRAKEYVGGAETGYAGSLDRVRGRFINHLANGRLNITGETKDFIKFFNLLEYRKLQFEIGFLLNSWDKGKTLPGKIYYLTKNYLYWNWWMYNMGFGTGKFSSFYPPRWYSMLLHPSENLGEGRFDRRLKKFFTRETKSGHVYTWDFENWVVSRKFLPSFLFRGLAKDIVSKNALTGVEEFLENQTFWSLKGLSDFLVKYRGKGHGLVIKGLRAAPKLGLPVAVLGGRGAWVQYALRKGIGKLVTKAISLIAGTVAPVVGAIVTEVGAWLGGKALKMAWKKPGEAVAYVIAGGGCGCLALFGPLILLILAMMAIIPGMKKYEYGAGIPPGGGGGLIEWPGIPPQVVEGELPEGYEDITDCPAEGLNVEVTSDFGWRCDIPGRPCHFHDGTDFNHDLDGEPAGAVGLGTVIEVYTDSTPDDIYGDYVRIQHPGGYVSIYGHLAHGSITVSVGDTVSAGDTIGTVDNTGNSTAPHLHLGIMVLGEGYVDPCRVLPECCD